MTGLNGRGHQLNARAETELGEDVRDVALHGPPGQEQLRGDVRARSTGGHQDGDLALGLGQRAPADARPLWRPAAAQPSLPQDRKSTRLNSSHGSISYAVFCLKKKNTELQRANLVEKKKTKKK